MDLQETRTMLLERVEDFKTGKLKGDAMPIGLKKRREATANWSEKKAPGYHCDNCNCDRFTKCKCQTKKVVQQETAEATPEGTEE